MPFGTEDFFDFSRQACRISERRGLEATPQRLAKVRKATAIVGEVSCDLEILLGRIGDEVG